MKFLSFWKKANRGIILAALLFVAFGVFAVADTVSFEKEKVRIEQTIRSYVEQSPQLAMLSPLRTQNEGTINKAVADKQKKNKEILKKYWSFHTDKWGFNQGEVLCRKVQELSLIHIWWTAQISAVLIVALLRRRELRLSEFYRTHRNGRSLRRYRPCARRRPGKRERPPYLIRFGNPAVLRFLPFPFWRGQFRETG